MNTKSKFFSIALIGLAFNAHAAQSTVGTSHDISYPKGWQNWATVAVSHRIDNNTLRTILGNNLAIKAMRSGQTNPWPDGAVLAKVVWKQKHSEEWDDAIVPAKFVHAEFMFKDSVKYKSTHGWGWVRWVGMEQKPFNKGASVCISCHTPVANNDWVFTAPAILPKN